MPEKSHVEPGGSHMTSFERQRLRDLSQYYFITTSDEHAADHDGFSNHEANLLSSGGVAAWTPRSPTLAADPVLTTLTQAAALTLGVERCLVSIIDDRCQHVIAEATRSVSPFDINRHDEGDDILLGVQSLPFDWGVCSTFLSTFINHSPILFSQPGNISSPAGVLISDLVAENRSCFVPVVLQNRQRLRFYAGVPLLSPAGRCIGVVCAFDPRPRPGRTTDLEKLRESTAVISQYITTMRLRRDNSRAERLLKGMADFLHGSELVDHKSEAIGSALGVSGSTHTSCQSADDRNPGSIRPSVEQGLTTVQRPAPGEAEVTKSQFASTCASMTAERIVPTHADSESALRGPPDTPRPATGNPTRRGTLNQHSDRDESVKTTVTDVASVFSRSSRLIRECMDLDGACFLEVSHKQRFHSIERSVTGDLALRRPSCISISDLGTSTDSASEKGTLEDELSPLSHVSDCLGCSVADNDSLLARQAMESSVTVPATLLMELTLLFPQGCIFHFDRYGGFGSSEDDTTAPSRKESKIEDQMSGHFEKARGLMFVPLYDHVGKHAYAGFFGWTNDPRRSLQQRELYYVAGFAHSIMSEIMRHQSLEMDTVKSSFITSISHELRSPLHGVLAANQLLAESTLSRDQNELVMATDNCARTLLDVLNQLFDHAKITGFGRARKPNRKTRGKKQRAEGSRVEGLLLAKTHLPMLLEDTIASLVVHDSHLSSPIFELDLSLESDGRRASLANRSSFISVAIDPTADQQFWSHSGLWRTIIINLVGNAIKFTDGGNIHVTLRVSKSSSRSSEVGVAELRVLDTGQGISKHFLRHRCFEPYAQEDNMSTGTGLGLSIVHRATMSLRGTVAVDSVVGSGTDVVVRVPMQSVRHDDQDESVQGDFVASQFAIYRDIKFHLDQTTDQHSDEESAIESHCARASMWLRVRDTLTSILTGWFGMEYAPLERAGVVFVEHQMFEEQKNVYNVAGLDVVIIAQLRAHDILEGTYLANVVVLKSPLSPRSVLAALKRLDEQRTKVIDPGDHEIGNIAQGDGSLKHGPGVDHSLSPRSRRLQQTLRPDSLPIRQPPRPRFLRSESSSGKKTVLLVDDNDINLRLLVIMMRKLDKQGFETITACDGQQAVNCFIDAVGRGRKIHLIFMDISMPVMDGMEATRRIRAHEKSKGLHPSSRAHIIAVTGLASAKDKQNILSSGVDMYIQKPVNLNVLRQTLSQNVNGSFDGTNGLDT